jgi:hypothetical protein
LDTEVLIPGISAGVEEASQLTSFWVHTRKIRPFVTIAEMTGKRKVRLVIASMMLLRHNVLDVKCDDIVLLMNVTILAAISRSVAHVGPGLSIHLRRMRLNDQGTSLLLEHGNYVHGVNVGVVLSHFLGRHRALITLLGKLLDARLHIRISA